MNPDPKTHLLIGTLVAAVIIVAGYGVYRELDRPAEPTPGPEAPSAAQAPSQEPAPSTNSLSIQAESSVVADTNDHQASVSGTPDLSYEWSIQNGTIEGVATGASITWTAGTGPAATLTCKVTNPVGETSVLTQRVVLQSPPAISQFEAVPPVVTEGASSKLRWTATSAQQLILDPGSRDVSKVLGAPLEVKPEETTSYTLTATNDTGLSVTREVIVKVVPLPVISAFRAESVAGSNTNFTIIGEFKGGKAELKRGDQVLAGSETSPLSLQLSDVKVGSSLTLTITNEAGTFVTSSLTFSTKQK